MGVRVPPRAPVFILLQANTANSKETQLRKMKPGQSADISVDEFGKKYHGYVESMPGATGAVTSLLPPKMLQATM
jgi:membrane fusion protein (multidrug efflux system)